MRSSISLISVSLVFTATLLATPAGAGTIVVAPNGANTATCGTPAAPCLTLQQGHTRVDAGGTVLLAQPGNYGAATITKPINIRAVPGAGIFSPTTPCLTINTPGANDTVSVSGLTCDMDGAAKDGVLFNDGHKLRLDNATIRGNSGTTCGVRVKPSSGAVELMTNNTSITEGGTTGINNGGGICILPTGTANVSGVIRNTILQNNRHGLVSAPTGSAVSNILVANSDLSHNAGGVFSVGSNSHICITGSTITGNSVANVGGGGDVLNGGDVLIWSNGDGSDFTGGCNPP